MLIAVQRISPRNFVMRRGNLICRYPMIDLGYFFAYPGKFLAFSDFALSSEINNTCTCYKIEPKRCKKEPACSLNLSLSVYLSVCLSSSLSLSVCLSLSLCPCPSAPVSLSLSLSVCLSLSLCLCRSISVSVCLSVSLCLSLSYFTMVLAC